jgi:tetratricopeptide (TPR) repeat protein
MVTLGWLTFRPAREVPKSAEALALESKAFLVPGKYERALDMLNRAAATDPNSWNVYYQRAHAKEGLGDVDGALADYDSTLRLNPDLIEARNGRAEIYISKGDYARAVADLTKGIAIKATVQGYTSRGQAYAFLGQHQKAIDDFTWVIDTLRDAPHVRLARANSRRALGDVRGAQEDQDLAESSALDLEIKPPVDPKP